MTANSEDRAAFDYLCSELLSDLEKLDIKSKMLLANFVITDEVSEEDLKACRELCSGISKLHAQVIGRKPVLARFISTREGLDLFLTTLKPGQEFTHREALIWVTENTLMSPDKFAIGSDGKMPLAHYITVEIGRKVKSGSITRLEKGVYSVS